MRFKGIGIVLYLLLQVTGTSVMIVSGVVKNQASVMLDGITRSLNQGSDISLTIYDLEVGCI